MTISLSLFNDTSRYNFQFDLWKYLGLPKVAGVQTATVKIIFKVFRNKNDNYVVMS
jgi:hypothetical protein